MTRREKAAPRRPGRPEKIFWKAFNHSFAYHFLLKSAVKITVQARFAPQSRNVRAILKAMSAELLNGKRFSIKLSSISQ